MLRVRMIPLEVSSWRHYRRREKRLAALLLLDRSIAIFHMLQVFAGLSNSASSGLIDFQRVN